MITPYLNAKQGWRMPRYLHDDLRPILEETCGVVVFHEQVIEMIAQFTGCTLAEADEARRALGDVDGMAQTKLWFFPRATGPGTPGAWSRGLEGARGVRLVRLCKAHAAVRAADLPVVLAQGALPAHFLAGVLTHDPGMYPKRLILDDARQLGIAVLGLDVNASEKTYVVERWADEAPSRRSLRSPSGDTPAGLPDGRAYGIRLALSEVKGISEAEVDRVVAAQAYHSLTDFWHRARVSRPVVERLVLAGGFDSVYGIGRPAGDPPPRQGDPARPAAAGGRPRPAHACGRPPRAEGIRPRPSGRAARSHPGRRRAGPQQRPAGPRGCPGGAGRDHRAHRQDASSPDRPGRSGPGLPQSRATRPPRPVTVQLALDLGDTPVDGEVSGLPEMNASERVRAELEILGLDASRHVVDFYSGFLDAIGVTRAVDLPTRRSRSEVLVAGVKVATQTPPIRSGRRVVFLTLDDGTGPADATFFEDVQGPTPPRCSTPGCSWSGCCAAPDGTASRCAPPGAAPSTLHDCGGRAGTTGWRRCESSWRRCPRASGPRARRPCGSGRERGHPPGDGADPAGGRSSAPARAGGMGRRRVLVTPAGSRCRPTPTSSPRARRQVGAAGAPRKLWHSSPGSSGG